MLFRLNFSRQLPLKKTTSIFIFTSFILLLLLFILGDNEPGLAERFGVSGAPVFKWFAKGQTSNDTPAPFYVVSDSGGGEVMHRKMSFGEW